MTQTPAPRAASTAAASRGRYPSSPPNRSTMPCCTSMTSSAVDVMQIRSLAFRRLPVLQPPPGRLAMRPRPSPPPAPIIYPEHDGASVPLRGGRPMTWSLEQAYNVYPQIEEEFSAALDQSLHPRGPDLLFDLVARIGLAAGAVALDVGCGEGREAVALRRRFGFRVTGLDPVPRHIELARAAAGQDGLAFAVGTAENIPAGPGTADLVWCRDVLVHVPNLPRAYAEFRRVLRPGG